MRILSTFPRYGILYSKEDGLGLEPLMKPVSKVPLKVSMADLREVAFPSRTNTKCECK